MKKNILCLMMVLFLSVILVGCSETSVDYEENLDNFFTTIHDYERFPEMSYEIFTVESVRHNFEEFMTPEYYDVVLEIDFWDIAYYIESLYYNGVGPIKDLAVSIKEATPDGENMLDVTAEVSYIRVKIDGEYETKYTFYLDCDTESGRIARIHKYARNYENLIE